MANRRDLLRCGAALAAAGVGSGVASLSGCAQPSAKPAAPAPAERLTSEVVGRADPGSFFENLAFGPDHALYLTDYTRRQVLRYTPADGLRVHAQLDAHPLGILFAADGTLVVSAQAQNLFGGGGTMANARLLYKAPPGGALARWMELEGGAFINGMALLGPQDMLIADSRGGVLWLLDATTGRSAPFVRDPLLDVADPKTLTPAANGVKLHRGAVYVSNTTRGLLLRVPLEGRKPGKVEVFAENVRADDFDFSPEGKLYYTTHRDRVFVLEGGRPVEFAGADSGVLGNTALAWAPDGSGLYVTTDGGFVAQEWYGGPAAGPAQIVRFARWR